MAGFSSYGAVADAHLEGREKYSAWYKLPNQVTVQGVWFDLSMSPGSPAAQYYAASPLVATPMAKSSDGGLDHGDAVSPRTKHLRRSLLMSNSATGLPMPMMLLDYLLFYPFVDESVTDPQVMDNTLALPRYATGEGVRIMPVVVGAHSLAANVTFTCSYTNSDGVAGRTTGEAELTSLIATTGTLATCHRNLLRGFAPFLPLQSGDTGVRSIESCTFLSPDIGLIALVLVKPLAQGIIRERTAPVEKDFLIDHAQATRIYDDAYLNHIVCPSASLSGVRVMGELTTAWN